MEKGLEKGLRQTIYDVLDIKFGAAGLRLFDQIDKTLSLDHLEEIRVGLKNAQSVQEAKKVIEAHKTK